MMVLKVVEVLISNGAKVDAKNKADETALNIAVGRSYCDIAELLILHVANVNSKDISGLTLLDRATVFNDKEMIEFIISHGANDNTTEFDGEPVSYGSTDIDKKLKEGIPLSFYGDLYAKPVEEEIICDCLTKCDTNCDEVITNDLFVATSLETSKELNGKEKEGKSYDSNIIEYLFFLKIIQLKFISYTSRAIIAYFSIYNFESLL
ncbi:hypothetical protein TVAG_295680 [Trichomonas vaginalis G3]|uniref:Uncharacterized protein n=1 Tax=Trichomonas vaginalis (strain ATCC PRA-98 / G3) TaxID=412133 RepID=A2F235_TRIV3|nr:Ankyrin repeat family [Trichomonas vaginalis G3]EAY01034.1 hypothetical protein TVAG_295680 [Trichomonas vaginalis G3]KAI5488629.1 Ankyrin repeat family [Trichomonas vaginalis G3]|eukprot:XP_001313920.1 hypothetical protein [Trichomonas vaginalis G3]